MSKKENKNHDDIIEFKLITLGDSGVGKTSILKRYINQKFDQNMISTVGFGISVKEITTKKGTKIKLKLIDTAGQENLKAISNSYLKNADCALFVFSHDSKESFNNITNWIYSLKESNNNINQCNAFPAYLIGNKSDLDSEIDENEIKEFTGNNKFYGYISTSAKNNIGINQVFEEIVEMLIKVYGTKKQKQNIKLAAKNVKKKKNCFLCAADL